MTTEFTRKLDFVSVPKDEKKNFLNKEWLVTNGLGGYASGTIGGAVTRRYHSYLTASLPSPFGRMVLFNHISEKINFADSSAAQLSSEENPENVFDPSSNENLESFSLESGIPVWVYRIKNTVLEKRILMPYMQNTVHICYKLLKGNEPVELELRPSFNFRSHEAPVNISIREPYELKIKGKRCEIVANPDLPVLRIILLNRNASLLIDGGLTRDIFYRLEAERGYESKGTLWTPGFFKAYLIPGEDAFLSASAESWETLLALNPVEAQKAEFERRKRLIETPKFNGVKAELTIAADQFIIKPVERIEDEARARASGDEIRSIIAGYHWFTDWGRDTMISLEGLTLSTGRVNEARWILRTFAHYVRDGLIPNLFPEGEKKGLYHTADATLWFFHALDRYLEYSNDLATMDILIPVIKDIIEHHLKGTDFGIKMDENDCLLKQGKEGFQLTWMDAKVDDWVVTPRRGKAVEINALWYNAICVSEKWMRKNSDTETANKYSAIALRIKESFNKKFWNEAAGYLFDVIEGENGNDSSCRPNQVFSISLPNSVLNEEKWKGVLKVVQEKLLTPVGLRSLAPGSKDYKPKYFGDLRARDAAYHQGTVWAWLIGPFIDAYLKVYPGSKEDCRNFLKGFEPQLNRDCIGTISEIFDAEAPFTPRGCIAQAWSVAEVLRSYAKLDTNPISS
jgi:predicted glycogen debranching enzyme